MRAHLGVKESDPAKFPADKLAAVAEVLRTSTSVRVSEDGKRVGRVSKLLKPEAVQAEVDARSIAANPFPYTITMEEVESFFREHGEVKSVRLPKHATSKNAPSGFAVIEFSSEEEAQKVLKMELVCEGATLELEPKAVFDTRKEAVLEHGHSNRQSGREQSQRREKQWNGRSQENPEDDYTKGLIVSFAAKKIGAADEAEKAADAADKEEGGDEGEKLSREDIKGGLTKFGIIRYVDYAKGESTGYLRFDVPEDAQKLRAAAVIEPEGGLTIANHLVTFEALEGDDEKEYWKKLREGQGQKRDFGGGGRGGFQNNRGFDNRGRGRGGGGRFGGRGGGGGRGGRGGRGRGDRDGGRDSKFDGKHKRFNESGEGGSNKSQRTE
ncbi:hypothetical protein M758_11G030600 [Ceratodon purpureus]|nr:hypothetical protein KC19_11G032200 [Ceratodon purpureus]KAG0556177.1 hypothetical protein KC19_11G032200 [Ceratodon purpureus]KAG0600399.1 hypothetical protein M758_11G030600 [Ceratodon purpureus]KAG0600400.1 hypothetical protein M758_11G030600 [Ceratodon purpureus]